MNIEDIIDNAKQYIRSKDYQQAILLLEKYKTVYSDNFELLFELGKSYLFSKSFADAVSNLETSLKLRDDIWAKILLAKAFYNTGKLRQSLSLLFDINRLNKENVDTEILNILLAKNKFFTAYRFAEKYINSNKIKYDIFSKVIDYIFQTVYYKQKFLSDDTVKFFERISVDFIAVNKNFDLSDIEIKITELYCSQFISLSKEFRDKFFNLMFDKFKSIRNKHYNNILNRLEKFDKKIELQSYPIGLSINLTSLCNIRCKFCKIHIQHTEVYNLPDNIVNQVINIMPSLQYINWLGGEVFLYNRFEELFDTADKNNIHQEIVTNALLLNEQWIDKFVSSNMTLSISCTSVDKEKYECLHEGAKFDLLLNNLNYLKNRFSKKHKDFKLWLYVLVIEDNYKELDDIIEFAKKYGFDVVRFQPMVYSDKDDGSFVDIFNEKYEFIEDVRLSLKNAIIKANKYNMHINNILPVFISDSHSGSNNSANKNDALFCKHPWTTMIIHSDLNVTFDCSCLKSSSIGYLNDKTLLELWNYDAAKTIRQNISVLDGKLCNKNCFKYNVNKY